MFRFRAVRVLSAGNASALANTTDVRRDDWTSAQVAAAPGCRSRHSYLMSIAQQMKLLRTNAMFGADEKLFRNVFKCLIDGLVASQKQDGHNLFSYSDSWRIHAFSELIMSNLYYSIFLHQCRHWRKIYSRSEHQLGWHWFSSASDGSRIFTWRNYPPSSFAWHVCVFSVYDPPSENEIICYREI